MIFTFEVKVEVDIKIPADDEWNRTPEQYALDALYAASLREAKYLDGWADLEGDARISGVTPL